MFNEGNQIHNFMSSSGSGTVINYGSGSGSDFLTSYGSGSGSGSTSQKVTVPVPVPQHCRLLYIDFQDSMISCLRAESTNTETELRIILSLSQSGMRSASSLVSTK